MAVEKITSILTADGVQKELQAASVTVNSRWGLDLSGANAVANGVTKTVAHPVTQAQLKSFYIISDQAVALQINTTDKVVNLDAGVPYYWSAVYKMPNPIAFDWTTIGFHNASGVPANIFVENGENL